MDYITVRLSSLMSRLMRVILLSTVCLVEYLLPWNYANIMAGTMFISLTDANLTYTAFNLSMVNPHVTAGPFLYQAG
jgi:hypothetical protein